MAILGCVLMVGQLLAAGAGPSVATQTITITIEPWALIDVPQMGALTLDKGDPSKPFTYLPAHLVQPKGLALYHNLNEQCKVLVEARPLEGGPCDIDLDCQAVGFSRPGALIKHGVVQGPRQITGPIDAGPHAYDLAWEASASALGTPAGSYKCQIVFTFTDH